MRRPLPDGSPSPRKTHDRLVDHRRVDLRRIDHHVNVLTSLKCFRLRCNPSLCSGSRRHDLGIGLLGMLGHGTKQSGQNSRPCGIPDRRKLVVIDDGSGCFCGEATQPLFDALKNNRAGPGFSQRTARNRSGDCRTRQFARVDAILLVLGDSAPLGEVIATH